MEDTNIERFNDPNAVIIKKKDNVKNGSKNNGQQR